MTCIVFFISFASVTRWVLPLQRVGKLNVTYKQIPEILVGNFLSVRTVRVVYHVPKISGLSHRARLDSSCNMNSEYET